MNVSYGSVRRNYAASRKSNCELTKSVSDKNGTNDRLHSETCNSFDSPELALPASLLKWLCEINFMLHSKNQAASLPKIWAGRNLLAQTLT